MIPVDRESETSVRQVAEDFGISWRCVAGSRQEPSSNQTAAADSGRRRSFECWPKSACSDQWRGAALAPTTLQ
jgi:hypothetical protein